MTANKKNVVVAQIYHETSEGSLYKLSSRRHKIFKDGEMRGTLGDGRRVKYYPVERKWGIPHRVSRGEVSI